MRAVPLILVAAGSLALGSVGSFAAATNAQTMVTPNELHWGPAPDVLPRGAQAAVLFGDPKTEGLFALRLKMPAGYAVPPHTHPVVEVVTVISGNFRLGMGERADRAAAAALPAGSFFAVQPGMAHFAYADDETVVQITTNGPWGLTYVNPKDDPRKGQ